MNYPGLITIRTALQPEMLEEQQHFYMGWRTGFIFCLLAFKENMMT